MLGGRKTESAKSDEPSVVTGRQWTTLVRGTSASTPVKARPVADPRAKRDWWMTVVKDALMLAVAMQRGCNGMMRSLWTNLR